MFRTLEQFISSSWILNIAIQPTNYQHVLLDNIFVLIIATSLIECAQRRGELVTDRRIDRNLEKPSCNFWLKNYTPKFRYCITRRRSGNVLRLDQYSIIFAIMIISICIIVGFVSHRNTTELILISMLTWVLVHSWLIQFHSIWLWVAILCP